MQAYRSGHNEAVLKTVWVKAHGGSNPSACATKKKDGFLPVFFLCTVYRKWRGIRGWEPRTGESALPQRGSITKKYTAKDAVDNGGAGRVR